MGTDRVHITDRMCHFLCARWSNSRRPGQLAAHQRRTRLRRSDHGLRHPTHHPCHIRRNQKKYTKPRASGFCRFLSLIICLFRKRNTGNNDNTVTYCKPYVAFTISHSINAIRIVVITRTGILCEDCSYRCLIHLIRQQLNSLN